MDNEVYLKEKIEKKDNEIKMLEEKVSTWRTAFGWTCAFAVLFLIVIIIGSLSNTIQYTGYTPEQCGDLAIKMISATRG